jgi:hypothetical protein
VKFVDSGSKHKKAYLFLDLAFFMNNDYASWNRCPTCWVGSIHLCWPNPTQVNY